MQSTRISFAGKYKTPGSWIKAPVGTLGNILTSILSFDCDGTKNYGALNPFIFQNILGNRVLVFASSELKLGTTAENSQVLVDQVGGALGKSLRNFKEGMKEEEEADKEQKAEKIEDKKDD